MGKVFKAIGGLFGLGVKAAKPNTAPAKAVVNDQKKAITQSRASLYQTEGGVAGQELNPDQVKKRDTLFGN